MIDLTYDLKTEKIISQPILNTRKKNNINKKSQNSYNTRLPLLSVRGFN
jgi:hypothetical protein